jgi:hypothetical protein
VSPGMAARFAGTVGGVVSGAVAVDASLTSEKSSIVTEPASFRPNPTERLVAPDGTAGVVQEAWVQVDALAKDADCDQ